MKNQAHQGNAGGRPRDPEVERRILNTTLQLLEQQGFRRMSIDTVAETAGVSKPTIYRRWPNKADLAMAALSALRVAEPLHEDTTGLDRLRQVLLNFRKSLLRPNGLALIGTVLAEEPHTPELLALFREKLVDPRRAMVREALEQAAAKGELPPNSDIGALVNMLIGSFYARYLSGKSISSKWVDRLIDVIAPRPA